jgi:hypothetical protein
MRRRLAVTVVVGMMGCARAPAVAPTLPARIPDGTTTERTVAELTSTERAAVERRIAELRGLGGVCAAYGAVVERSYAAGLITIRPFMWRVNQRLAAAQATRDGAMTIARDIDSLNVGVRPVDDLVWSIEHEAAHIAFEVPAAEAAEADRANEYVRACRAASADSVTRLRRPADAS